MEKIKVLTIFGTRPEAIKMAPLVKELEKRPEIESKVCVTAQHREMLDQVLELFDIKPDFDLDIMKNRQTLTGITNRVLEGLEKVFTEEKPDMRHSLYHSAIDLYKGQLLPRFEHELWLMQLSMYYQSLYLQITKEYVRPKMDCKDYILAQKTAIDALRFDPKDSELNMYAILAMGFQGNLSMAQTYYTAAKPYLALEHAEVIKKYLHIK